MLGDDVRAALPELQEQARSLMGDTFDAYSPAGTTPDVDGYDVPAFTSEGTTSGKIQARSRQGDTATRTVRVGDIERPVLEGGLHIPIGATVPGIGWEYVCTAVGQRSDPALLNRRYRVVDVPAKTYATARRLDVVQIS